MSFGLHIMLDCRVENSSILGDQDHIHDFLYNFPDEIGMERIDDPNVVYYEGCYPEDRGYTGVVLIAESHISIHTFIDKNYMFIDIFSCRHFDPDPVVKKIMDKFNITSYKLSVLERGRDFPRTENG
jgi:S-adenosylmethionine decarboxylase